MKRYELQRQALKIAHQIKGFITEGWKKCVKVAWAITNLFFGRPIRLSFTTKNGEKSKICYAFQLGNIESILKGYITFQDSNEEEEKGWKWCRCGLAQIVDIRKIKAAKLAA